MATISGTTRNRQYEIVGPRDSHLPRAQMSMARPRDSYLSHARDVHGDDNRNDERRKREKSRVWGKLR